MALSCNFSKPKTFINNKSSQETCQIYIHDPLFIQILFLCKSFLFPLIIYHCWKFTRKTFPKDDEKKLVYFLIQCECTGSDCGIHVVTLSHLTDNSNLLWKRFSFVGIHSPYLGTGALWDEKRESRKSHRQQSSRLIFQFSWKFQADRMEFWENPNLVKFNVKSVKAIYYKNVWKYCKMKNVGRSFNSERIQKHCDNFLCKWSERDFQFLFLSG